VDPNTPDNLAIGLQNGRLAITTEDLKTVFDPVVDKVCVTLGEQLEAIRGFQNERKTQVLLVGGFGSNEYLKRRVLESFPDCAVIQPTDA
jgi:hypothetical protein